MNTTRLRTRLRFLLAGALTAVAVALPAAQTFDGEADPQPAAADLAVVGGLLIDGHEGPPLAGAVVLVEGNRIVAVGSRDELTVPDGAEVIDARGMTILPGLIDAHVHLDILGHSDYQHWHGRYRDGRYAEIMAISTRQLLLSGVTTVVDLAGQPAALGQIQDRIESGDLPGPRVVASMGWITNWTDEQVARHHRRSHTVNVRTVEEARAAARTAIAQGAGIIKVHTGLTESQMRAIREEADAAGIRITGHVGTRDDLLMRIRTGQDGIEHLSLGTGSGPTVAPEVLQGLVDQGTYVIPTMIQTVIQGRAVEWPDWRDNPRARAGTPPAIWADIRRSIEHPRRFGYFGGSLRVQRIAGMSAKLRQLRDAGVRVLVGTDSGTPLNFHTDALWQEMDLMVSYGFAPLEVLAMATRRNAEYLGRGAELGTVTRGKLADLIVVDGNPLLSMRDLRNVVTVVKDGRVYTP
ncbi:MAG: amidohydrolase family protein [Acidobacteria bacterium]|nr:amidohydrolase family protein [Acidobacteriota bacterium]